MLEYHSRKSARTAAAAEQPARTSPPLSRCAASSRAFQCRSAHLASTTAGCSQQLRASRSRTASSDDLVLFATAATAAASHRRTPACMRTEPVAAIRVGPRYVLRRPFFAISKRRDDACLIHVPRREQLFVA